MSPGPVFVTGAGSGIGWCLAGTLGGKGHRVYAGARKPSHLRALADLPNVVAVRCDVTRPEEIEAAVRLVRDRGEGLYGLVNNAGVGGLGGFVAFTDRDLRDMFDVNVFGPHRMTNACLPLLLERRGRIVNIGSQGGSITKRYFGPYTMTKFALEAYTVSLDEEMAPHGVRASIVQPGGIVSEIDQKSLPSTLARLARARPPFRDEAQALAEAIQQPGDFDPSRPEGADNRNPSPPDLVATAVEDALFSPHPRRRYLVGTRWEGDRVLAALLERLLDANESPSHGYSRDELVALLDRHLAERKNPPR